MKINLRNIQMANKNEYDVIEEALKFSNTLIKFCVPPEKCINRNDEVKSGVQVYKGNQKALNALQKIREREEWQPIGTAPKEGTDVLVIGLIRGKISAQAICYFEEHENKGWLCSRTDKPQLNGTITHWKPLPEPPRTLENGGDDE